MIFLKNRYIYVALSSIILISSCQTQKRVVNTESIGLKDTFRMTADSLQIDTTQSMATLSYRDFFKDQRLVELIDSGLARNNDLLAAVKQIELSRETMKQMKWGYLPTASLAVGAASINRPSNNSLNGVMTSQFLGKSYIEDYSSSLTLSWEADIWGKIKASNAVALSAYLETQEAVNAVRTSLVAGIAQGYYSLLMFDEQIIIGEQNLALMDSTLSLTEVQLRLGLTNSLAVQQLENSRDNLLKSIRVLHENRSIQENALSLLIGKMPDVIKNRGKLSDIDHRSNFAVGVPASLLSHRPDIRQAEIALYRSLSSIKVARANMYPALRITAQGGVNSFTASNWFSVPGSLFGMLTGSLTQPLLQGRQLKTAYNQANIRFDQAEIEFKGSVLKAVTEVSNVLEQISSLEDQQQYNEQLVSRNVQLIAQAKVLFKNDMATYLEILIAQQGKLQAELDRSMVKSRLLSSEVSLYKALGGGVD